MTECRICGGALGQPIEVREMMFGLRDRFTYLICSACGCLQIAGIPDDMKRYYGSAYYSFESTEALADSDRAARNKRRYRIWRRLAPLVRFLPMPRTIPRILGALGLDLDVRILDVGAGSGNLVSALREISFSNALGIDPFLDTDVLARDSRILVRKAELSDIDPAWDLIMFNHSFEHMAAQQAVLETCRRILSPGGRILIRIPTVSSYAFEKYGVNWVQLDAPRHFYLHSRKSIALLAQQTGFTVVRIWDDSNAFQFIGSEQYLRDIPLMAEDSYLKNADRSMFTRRDIHRFKKLAAKLNGSGSGDQICVLLTPS